MLIKYLKKISPTKEKLIQYKSLNNIFGHFIDNPHLWHFNRFSVAKAFSVGLFVAWLPIPFQMLLAALGAIIFNANLPLSIALVSLTNPITMPPLFLFAYILGAKILLLPIKSIEFELSFKWLCSLLGDIWQPFLLGSLICAVVSAILGNIIITLIWRYFTAKSWKERNKSRNKLKN